MTLASGRLATDELAGLQISASALLHSPVEAGRILEQQRELAELERAAREVPGAEDRLRAELEQARHALASGQPLDLTPLWATLEQYMGQAAQQRESFDARADHVVHEYDRVRSLAGETTQRLGRLADTLRSQRRLGPMSTQARERYAQTLTDAEALLAEARAEYQAAQEVTASFGSDALSGLLDVFDLGGGDSQAGLFSVTDLPAQAAPPASERPSAAPGDLNSMFASLLTPPAQTSEKKAQAHETDWGRFNVGQVDRWTVLGGQLAGGSGAEPPVEVAGLLAQAERLGLHRLDMADALHVWSAQLAAPGQWRLARGRSRESLNASAGRWLETGSDALGG